MQEKTPTENDEVARADAGHAGRETVSRETLDVSSFAAGRPSILAVSISTGLTEGVDLGHKFVRARHHSGRTSCLV